MLQSAGPVTDFIFSKLNIQIQQQQWPEGKMSTRRLNVNRLDHFMSKQFAANLEGKLSQHIVAEKELATFRDLVCSTAFTYLDQNTHIHHDWFDENDGEIQKLLKEK